MNSETVKKPFPVPPSAAEYKRGFEAILNRLNDNQLAILQAHYAAPGHRATVHDLAEKCGIASWRTVNREYGEIAKRLLSEMGYAKPRNEDGELWLTAICFWYKGMVMYMRSEVVKALEEAGIVTFPYRGAAEASEHIEPSGTPYGEVPNELSNATTLIDETKVSAPASVPSTSEKAETSKIPPKLQAEADSKIDKYRPDLGILEGAKRILVITGKGDSAESAHAAIVQALDAGRELARERIEDLSLLTQNIDGSHDLVQLHGNVFEAVCLSCGHSYTPENIAEVKCPTDCPKCKGYDVILRGKRLDDDDLQTAREKAVTCEFCVVAGSSDVSDAAMRIAEIAKQSGAYLLEINDEETALSEIADGVHLGYSFLLFYFMVYLGRRNNVPNNDQSVPADLTPNSNIQKLRTSETHRIRVDFIRSFEFPFLNRLGMTFAPGKKQTDALTGGWDRDLRADLERLSNAFRARTLVSLLEDKEFEELQIRNFAAECARALINLVRFPIRDVSVPDSMEDFVLMVTGVVDLLKHGETIVTHCKGGLGRAGLATACIAVAATDAKLSASEAVDLVREARPGAVETETQEQFVAEFEKKWREVTAKREQPDSGVAKTSDEFTEHGANSDNDQNEGRENSAESMTETLAVSRQLSDKHFLIYWQERNVASHERSGYPLDVVSSRQLKRCNSGDTLWLATINQAGELVLAGRLRIGEIIDYQTAVRRLNDTSLWDGGFFALPKENEAEFLRQINLGDTAFELRFVDPESDRFILKNGKINAQQIQSMRELTKDSVQMLARTWETEEEKDIDFADDFDDEFDELDEGEDWAELLERLRQLVREEPYNADAHYNFGVACDENDLPQEANAAYRKAIELDPDYLGAYYNLGCNYLRSGELDESEQSFKAAIRLAPEFAPALFMLGVVYGELNDFERAISTTKEGLELDPEDPKGYFNVGNFYSHLRDFDKAAEWFEKSVEIELNAPLTFYRLGKCYRELGEKEKEFNAYLQAVELAPDFIDALFALGTVYAHLTASEEGRQVAYFETGGELDLLDARVSFYLGLGNLALGNVDEARESQNDLRKMDATLANKLQFFIDGFEGGIEQKQSEQEQENVNHNSINSKRRQRKNFKVKINGNVIEAKSIPELYKQVLMLLTDSGLLENASLPFATSPTRYLIAVEPIHPSGKNFFKHVEYGGFYMETNKNRIDAVNHLGVFVESLQADFENLEEEEPITIAEQIGKKQGAQPTVEQRFLGGLLGLAAGDALGTTVEFKPTGTFPRVATITGGGPFGLNAGEWTDDTSMALCLADSLIESNGFDAVDQMRRYCRWKNDGYLSSNGTAFDIGMTIRKALEKFESERTSDESTPFCGSVSPSAAGNGSLMRLAPVPLFFADDAIKAIDYAADSSRTTHGARECVDACRYLAALIVGAVQGKSKEELLSPKFTPVPGLWEAEPLSAKVAEIAEGSFKANKPPPIIGAIQGYVIPSLHVALWAFYHTDNFSDGALKAVNLGYDADTYGAIYGQLAGVYYGVQSIPADWLDLIAKRDLIESFAENLCKTSVNQ